MAYVGRFQATVSFSLRYTLVSTHTYTSMKNFVCRIVHTLTVDIRAVRASLSVIVLFRHAPGDESARVLAISEKSLEFSQRNAPVKAKAKAKADARGFDGILVDSDDEYVDNNKTDIFHIANVPTQLQTANY